MLPAFPLLPLLLAISTRKLDGALCQIGTGHCRVVLHASLGLSAVEGGWSNREGQNCIVNSKFDLTIPVARKADLSASMQRVTCGKWDFPDKIGS